MLKSLDTDNALLAGFVLGIGWSFMSLGVAGTLGTVASALFWGGEWRVMPFFGSAFTGAAGLFFWSQAAVVWRRVERSRREVAVADSEAVAEAGGA